MRAALIAGLLALILFIQPVSASQQSESNIYTITSIYDVKNLGPSRAENLWARALLFRGWSGWTDQRVLSTQISPREERIENYFDGENELARAIVFLDELSSGENRTITIVQVVEAAAINMQIIPDAVGETIPPGYENFTRPVDGLWESNYHEIAAKARELTENEKNPYLKVKRIINFVENYLTYKRQVEEHGALWAWQHYEGDCTEYTNLFIALCRAAGIPAKAVTAYGYKSEYAPDMSGKMGHAFALVYLPNFEWVPVDLTWPVKVASYGKLDYFHISFSVSGYTSPPSVGEIKIGYTYSGPKPGWSIRHIGSTIVREVGVDPSIEIGAPMQDKNLPLSVAVKNGGRYKAENLKVEVLGDQRYFGRPEPQSQSIASLLPEQSQPISFSIPTTGEAPGRRELTARVTYDVEYAGVSRRFVAEGEQLVIIPEVPGVVEVLTELMPVLLGVVVVLLIAAIAVAVWRR